jgi:hypothetical protein
MCGTVHQGTTCPGCGRTAIPAAVVIERDIDTSVSTDTSRIDDTGFSDGRL